MAGEWCGLCVHRCVIRTSVLLFCGCMVIAFICSNFALLYSGPDKIFLTVLSLCNRGLMNVASI